MSRTIKTYDDLIEERNKMKTLLILQKEKINEDWNAFKHEFDPVTHAFGTLGKMAKGDKSNPLINAGLLFAGELFIKNFVLAKAGWLTRLAVPFVVKNYSSHLIVDKGKTFVDKIGRLLKRRKSVHETDSPD
jgi:hypothetical protein